MSTTYGFHPCDGCALFVSRAVCQLTFTRFLGFRAINPKERRTPVRLFDCTSKPSMRWATINLRVFQDEAFLTSRKNSACETKSGTFAANMPALLSEGALTRNCLANGRKTYETIDVICLSRGIAVGQGVVSHKVDIMPIQKLFGNHPWGISDNFVDPPGVSSSLIRGMCMRIPSVHTTKPVDCFPNRRDTRTSLTLYGA